MGEAKRRKQLGLMPTVYPFEVRQNGQELELFSGPQDTALRERILAGMRDALGEMRSWPQQYRREYVMAGKPQKLLHTAADVEAIPVPPHRRWKGELLENYDPRAAAAGLEAFIKTVNEYHSLDGPQAQGTRGNWLHFRDEFSFDGQEWESFPASASPFEGLRYLMQHPVTALKGELVAEYAHEHTVEGVQTFDPPPPAEHLEPLQEMMRRWNGETPQKWAEIYYEGRDIPEEDEAKTPVPRAIRHRLELRKPAPLPGLGVIALDSIGDLDIYVSDEHRQISFDGETWEDYPLVSPDFDD